MKNMSTWVGFHASFSEYFKGESFKHSHGFPGVPTPKSNFIPRLAQSMATPLCFCKIAFKNSIRTSLVRPFLRINKIIPQIVEL
jgi:hypothetical protein